MNIDQIKQNYSKMDIDQLEKLVDEIAGLRKVAIPILQAELEKRNELSLLEKINQYKNVLKLKDKTVLDQHVKERLDSGEPMESIVFDLKNKGIDLGTLVFDKEINKVKISKEIIKMRSKGYRISKVKKEMIKKYDLDENEFNEIVDRIKSKSKYTILYGFFLVILGVWTLITTFYPFNLFFSIAFIILGVWAITQGYKKKHIDR